MENRLRYTINDVVKHNFYQLQKFLFEGEFENLNNDARVLYSMLKDRHELSIANGWTNEYGEVYIIFSRDEMCEKLKLTKKTVIKAMKTLKEFELIEEERIGQGHANKIYLLTVETLVNPQKCKKSTSEKRGVNSALSEVEKLHLSSINNTDRSESIYPPTEPKPETPVEQPKAAPPIDTIDTPAEIIKVLTKAELAAKISLAELKNKHSDKIEDLDIIFDVLSDILTNNNVLTSTVRISKQNLPFATVNAELQKLEQKHIEYVLHSLNANDNKHKINRNLTSYILTSLYNAPRTISYYFDRSFSPKPSEPEKKYDGMTFEEMIEKRIRKTLNL